MNRKQKPAVDERLYSLTSNAGERRSNLTRPEALALASKRDQEWRECGRTVEIRVFYRDGSEINWRSEAC